MKIALCGRFNTEKKHQGGSAEVFLNLARGLSKDNEVTLFGRGKPTEDIIDMCKMNNIKYYYIPSDSWINILLGPLRAIKLLKKEFNNFDIIHSHVGSFAFASIFLRNKSKIITHVHEIPEENPTIIKIYLLIESLLLKLAANKSDKVITASEYMKRAVMKNFSLRNVISINNGVDTKIFTRKIDKKTQKIWSTSKRLLFVGRLTKRKGILELINAIKFLKSDDVSLLVIGDGELDALVKTNIIGFSNIKIIPFVQNDKLSHYYSAAKLVIVPSHYEPAGLVPIEAMACGTPVLVSNNGGLKEIKNTFLIKKLDPLSIAEAIRRTLDNRSLSKKQIIRYIQKKYNWENIIKIYQKEYNGLLNKK